MARALERYGVRANAIAPRARTAMTADVFGEAPELADGQIDALSPEHVVTLVRFLASPAAEGVNGQLFIVYGPTVTLVAAPTVEASVQRGIRRLGPGRAVEYVAELLCWPRSRAEFLGHGADGLARLTVSDVSRARRTRTRSRMTCVTPSLTCDKVDNFD